MVEIAESEFARIQGNTLPEPPKLKLDKEGKVEEALLPGLISAIPGAFAMTPAIPGMAKAALDAGTSALFDGKSFGKEFEKESQDPISGGLIRAGLNARRNVREALGVPGGREPFTTAEQAIDWVGSALPIPLGLGANVLSKIARGTVSAITPTVHTGMKLGPMAARGAGQGAIFGGIDQGSRALLPNPDVPLVLSDAALTGIPDVPLPDAINLETGELSSAPPLPTTIAIPDDFDVATDPEWADIRQRDRAVDAQENRNDILKALAVGAVVLSGIGAVRYSQYLSKQSSLPAALGGDTARGRPDRPVAPLGDDATRADVGNRLHAEFVDDTSVLTLAVKKSLSDEDPERAAGILHQIEANKNSNAVDMAEQRAAGKFGDHPERGEITYSGESLNDIDLTFKSFIDEKRVSFLEGTAALRDKQDALFAGKVVDDVTEAAVHKMMQDPEQVVLLRRLAAFNNDVLDELVHRRIISMDEALAFRARSSTPNEGQVYLPGISAKHIPGMLERIAIYMGVKSTEGSSLRQVARFLARTEIDNSVVTQPIDAITSSRMYLYSAVAHANEQALAHPVLARASGMPHVRFDKDTNKIVGIDKGFKGAALDSYARLLGVFNPNELIQAGDLVTGKFIANTADDLAMRIVNRPDMKLANVQRGVLHKIENTRIVQRDGVEFLYQVDPQLNRALDINAELARYLKPSRFFKNVMTAGTTGVVSVFAPKAALFASQLGAITGGVRGKTPIGALKAIGEVEMGMAKGLYNLFKTDASQVWSDFAARSIARHLSQGREAPEIYTRMRNVLSRSINNAVLDSIRKESGKGSTSIGSLQSRDTFEHMLAQASKTKLGASTTIDALKSAGKTIAVLNRSFQESTAIGMALRKIKPGMSGNQIREIVYDVKNITGDVNRSGTSPIAKGIQASVPFSGAAIQSFNAVASAIKAVGFTRGTILLASIVGLPTMVEFMYSHGVMLSDVDEDGNPNLYFDGNRFWTQLDFYYNGYNEKQKASSAFIPIPGVEPWRWPSIPIAPEWALGRNLTLEMMDMLTGMSSVGNKEGLARSPGSTLFASFYRLIDIPIPPILSPILVGVLGVDFRAGVQETSTTEDGQTLTFSTSRSIEGRTGTPARTKYINDVHDETLAKIIQDMFGALGTAYLAVSEAFFAGSSGERGTEGGIADAFGAVGDEIGKQAPYSQPLFGRALTANKDNAINKTLFAKKAALTKLSREDYNIQFGRGAIDPTINRAIEPELIVPSQDPIFDAMARGSRNVLKSIQGLQDQVNDLEKERQRTGSSRIMKYNDRIIKTNAINNQINYLRAMQLKDIERLEKGMAEGLTEQLGRKVEIDFSKAYANRRPNRGEGPLGIRPPRLPSPSAPGK